MHHMPQPAADSAERKRLSEDASRERNWKRWGPYLAERQWGTVREDYSPEGDSWRYLTHDLARSQAYRWGEDGLMGICDRQGRLCFAVAMWNGADSILKERLYGLSGPEGNHGEDVKECYYYLDSTPTHSYMRALYKYPQRAFPYEALVKENARRGRSEPEYELADTGIFDGSRYFDVQTEYAKADDEDILIRITATNRGPEEATIHLLPTIWYRNTWVWGCKHEGCTMKPRISASPDGTLKLTHETLGENWFAAEPAPGEAEPKWLFTDNHTNNERLYNVPNDAPWVKDAFHEFIVRGKKDAINPRRWGTKVAAHYTLRIPAGESRTVRLRLASMAQRPPEAFGEDFDDTFAKRIREADAFYGELSPKALGESKRAVIRQAYAGLFWSKQFYHYVVEDWLQGDPGMPPPPRSRKRGRNSEWKHLFNRDVISMPDKWEYPWFAAWDTAFHMIAMADADPDFAKQQLELFLREWYMHPNGQMPAYEFAFSDVNPPVHAWAVWRVYKMTGKRGARDRPFLERAFHKLLMNFTWWVNRKDPQGRNIFSGGFLGLDNIGVFDRSQPLPDGAELEQADGTAWMAFYCGTMLSMAIELAQENDAYGDIASKFFEHFIAIADAINHLGGSGLWNEADGFYYDQIYTQGRAIPLKVRSMVGILPMLAVELLEESSIEKLKGFRKRMDWFIENRRDLKRTISYLESSTTASGERILLLAIPTRERLERMLRYLLSETEFLSPHGLRSLSRVHADHPFRFEQGGVTSEVRYVPGDSDSGMFGGNSNWRGPVWFPLNYLLIEAMERYDRFYCGEFQVEFPTGSGRMLTLRQVAAELAARLGSLFLPGESGQRPSHGTDRRYADDPHWRDLVLFHEYFHGDSGSGLGASHQTGWTALAIRLLRDFGEGEENTGGGAARPRN